MAALHRRRIETDLAQPGQPLRQRRRILVILGEAPKVVIEHSHESSRDAQETQDIEPAEQETIFLQTIWSEWPMRDIGWQPEAENPIYNIDDVVWKC